MSLTTKEEGLTATEYFVSLLKQYEIDTVFGIVGIPIVELADKMIEHGIRFISCRNEQAASYAASGYGYLTGKPAVLLVVGGPGLIHALAGIYNSMSNKWPLIVIAGSSNSETDQVGGFQDLDQVSLLNKYVKYTVKLNSINIPTALFNAYNFAIQSPMGVTYIDFPGNLIEGNYKVQAQPATNPVSIPRRVRCSPDPNTVNEVAKLIIENSSNNVLVILGKGAVEFHKDINKFINTFNLPFLPTPMAKGILPDSHNLNVSSARSKALKDANIVLVLGARLNWILHFGESPKWNAKAIFIQCDNDPSKLGVNNGTNTNLSLLGDLGLTVNSLSDAFSQITLNWKYEKGISDEMRGIILKNQFKLQEKEQRLIKDKDLLNYNVVYGALRKLMDESKTVLVTEGANSMDIARISFPSSVPKQRLDAGTNATMGIGLGYGIAACLNELRNGKRGKDVILIQGDSAFGFSGMEIETAVRFKLGLIIVVMNNSGIYHGVLNYKPDMTMPSTSLSQKCRYDTVAIGLGANGYLVNNIQELKQAFTKSLDDSRSKGETSVINVIIEPGKQTKVAFAWQNKPTSKL